MADKIKVMSIFGTRPEAIKMAPVVRALMRHTDAIETRTLVTAQHREMLDQVLHLFRITPDYDLNIMAAGQTLFDITSRAMLGINEVFQKERPDLVLVHGDTTTTFAGALAAYYHQIPVGHVEAGLRTHDIYSPFPEEMNRRLTGGIATLHFAPTATAHANLRAEGIPEGRIFITGNTVIDALHHTVRPDYVLPAELGSVDFAEHRVLLVTTHRRENLGEPMRHVYRAIRSIIEQMDDVEVIFPVHRNPKVREIVREELGGIPRVHLIDPLDYEPFANLMARVDIVLTDSGGIQEEAPSLGKPVLVLRDTTERPEAVTAGTVRLIGTDEQRVYDETMRLLTEPTAYTQMAEAVNPYGDGEASRRIIEAILYHAGHAQTPPEPFGA